MHLALGIIIASLFIMSDRFSTVFAVKGNLHPLLAAWLPNLVFSWLPFGYTVLLLNKPGFAFYSPVNFCMAAVLT